MNTHYAQITLKPHATGFNTFSFTLSDVIALLLSEAAKSEPVVSRRIRELKDETVERKKQDDNFVGHGLVVVVCGPASRIVPIPISQVSLQNLTQPRSPTWISDLAQEFVVRALHLPFCSDISCIA